MRESILWEHWKTEYICMPLHEVEPSELRYNHHLSSNVTEEILWVLTLISEVVAVVSSILRTRQYALPITVSGSYAPSSQNLLNMSQWSVSTEATHVQGT